MILEKHTLPIIGVKMKVYDSTLYDSVYETEYLRIDQVKFVEDSF